MSMTPETPSFLSGLWQARYRDGSSSRLIDNPVVRTLLSHRSVRHYLPHPLPENTLETLVAAAQSAATSSNLQAWSVIAVEDQERRDRLAYLAGNQAHIAAAPLFLVWVADLSRLGRMASRADSPREALDYTEMFIVAAVDATLAAQNAVIAAESLGLGTVYIGGLRNHPVEVAKELDLPPGAFSIFGLCVGHPDPTKPASVKPRLPQEAILHRERYDAAHEDARIARYDVDANGFQIERGLKPRAWSSTMLRRIGSLAGLSGRDVMKEALKKLGFSLR